MNRRQIRHEVFLTLFEWSFRKDEAVLDLLAARVPDTREEGDSYAKTVCTGVCSRDEDLNDIITRYSIGWEVARISKVPLIAMKIALYEILYMPDIPVNVSINEAVEIVKEYEGRDSAGFINGILGNYIRTEKDKLPLKIEMGCEKRPGGKEAGE